VVVTTSTIQTAPHHHRRRRHSKIFITIFIVFVFVETDRAFLRIGAVIAISGTAASMTANGSLVANYGANITRIHDRG
jgi:hypothetical protein